MSACPVALLVWKGTAGILKRFTEQAALLRCTTLLFSVALSSIVALAQDISTPSPFREDRILIKPKSDIPAAMLKVFHAKQQSELLRSFSTLGNIQVLRVSKGHSVAE